MNQLDLYIEEANINEDKKTSELQLLAELNKIEGGADINQTAAEEELKRVQDKANESVKVSPVCDYTNGMSGAYAPGANAQKANSIVAMISSSDATNWILCLIAFLLFMILINMKGE